MQLRNNIVANFGAQVFAVILGLIFLPIYLRILGVEAYGLIGFYTSLQAILNILDLGLSASVSRELARYVHSRRRGNDAKDLVWTLECVYWPAAILIAALMYATSGSIALHWLRPVTLTTAETSELLCLMGLATALQWPNVLYQGCFRGIERQVELNLIGAVATLARTAGCALVLIFFSPTIEAFLLWQVLVAGLQTVLSRIVLLKLLPRAAERPIFRIALLRSLLAFSLGMAGISLLSLLLMQTDRVVLSSLLPLTEFGYYAVAASISTALSSAIGPFFNALYPRYSGLVSAGKSTELSFLYHLSNQLLATIVAPVAMVIAFFSHDILLLWTGNSALAANSAPILSLMAIGTSLNGLVHLPYALQLAYGWTRFALVQNVIAVILFVPAIWWLAHRFGGVGAASAWVALNLGYVLISVPIMHRKLLLGQAGTWYRHDVLPPVIAAAITALIAKLLFPVLHDGFAGFMLLAAIGLATLTASAMSASSFRSWFKQFLCNRLADFR